MGRGVRMSHIFLSKLVQTRDEKQTVDDWAVNRPRSTDGTWANIHQPHHTIE
jgi:hypothetical protein